MDPPRLRLMKLQRPQVCLLFPTTPNNSIVAQTPPTIRHRPSIHPSSYRLSASSIFNQRSLSLLCLQVKNSTWHMIANLSHRKQFHALGKTNVTLFRGRGKPILDPSHRRGTSSSYAAASQRAPHVARRLKHQTPSYNLEFSDHM